MIGLPIPAVVFVSLLLCGVLLQFVVADTSASDYSYSLYGKTYRISEKHKWGDEARKQCVREQGSLVDIRSDEELTHLINAIRNIEGANPSNNLGLHLLVGGTYNESVSDPGKGKGTWYYESGNVMTYTKWHPKSKVASAKRACNTVWYSYNDEYGYLYNTYCEPGYYYRYICAREASGAFRYGFYGNSYYVASGGNNGFTGVTAAREKCRDHEGFLADIHSPDELRHVQHIIHSLYPIKQPVSTWWFAIGGKKVNNSWLYEDGTKMEYTNWIPGEEGKNGCAILDAVTTINTRNYRVEPCDKVHINYTICSKKVTGPGTSMDITGEYVEGHGVKWRCTSSPSEKVYNRLLFRVSSANLLPRTTLLWGTLPAHGWKYINLYNPVITPIFILSYTFVPQKKQEYVHTANRNESGLLVSCVRYGVPVTRLEVYTLKVAYPPSQTVISDTKNMIEGKLHVITVTVAESFPQSQVDVEFQSKHKANISHRQKSNSQAYPGFIAVSTITFVPDRSDNGTSITVRVTNIRFPKRNFGKTEIVQVLFEPKGDTKSQAGLKTEHIIGFLVGLLCLLCAAIALVVYIRLRGVKMCPSSATPPRRVFVDKMSTIETPNQRGGTVSDGIVPIPHDIRGPAACEYDDTSELPQYEPIVLGFNDTPISVAGCDIPPPETFAPDNTSAQVVFNEPYDVVQDHCSRFNTSNPNTYDSVMDETPLP